MTRPPLRVLVAEDSATARQLLREILAGDDELEVVGEAKNGLEAVELTGKLRPDVITMDIQMPVLDGFEATRRIMAESPTPIVVVSSSVDLHQVKVSMRAIQAGALTVVAKPVGPGAASFPEESRRLRETVKSMAHVKLVRRRRTEMAAPPRPALPVGLDKPARVIAIASSTGGPAALARILAGLPASFPVPVLAVQHIAPGFVNGLAAWLDANAAMTVKVAVDGEQLRPGTVYLAADGRHLGVSAPGTVDLVDGPPVGGFRPSANVLFESVARVFGRSSLAVVLTGMGRDGVNGLCFVRQAGGRVLAQDAATSVVFGMPGAAVEAGLVDSVLPLDGLAARLGELPALWRSS